MLSVHRKLKLLAFALGIFVCYTLFGVLQETIFRGKYAARDGADGERFTFSVAFVAIQSIACSLFAKGVTLTQDQPKIGKHRKFYFFISLFYVAGTVLSNMALQWINYPTQVVAKAAKPIPVMLLGVLIGKKSYAPQKYFFVLMIVIGVAMFIFKDKYERRDGEDPFIGSYLIGASLLMDGLVGAVQDRMRSVEKPDSMNFMLNVHGWSSAILVSSMAVTGEGRDFIEFAKRNPEIIWQMSLVAALGTVGQAFIAAMISNFGSLPLSLVTTTRKFFTVLVSVVLFGNNLTAVQWIATATIFSALLLDAIFSKKLRAIDEAETVEVTLEKVHKVSSIEDLNHLTLNSKHEKVVVITEK